MSLAKRKENAFFRSYHASLLNPQSFSPSLAAYKSLSSQTSKLFFLYLHDSSEMKRKLQNSPALPATSFPIHSRRQTATRANQATASNGTVQCDPDSLHCTLFTKQYILQNLKCKLYAAYVTLHNLHFTFYTAHSTLYTVYCITYTAHSTLHTVHITFYTAHCILHNIHCTLCTTHSTHHILHCTL